MVERRDPLMSPEVVTGRRAKTRGNHERGMSSVSLENFDIQVQCKF